MVLCLCSAVVRLRLQMDVPESAWNAGKPDHMSSEDWDQMKRLLGVRFTQAANASVP